MKNPAIRRRYVRRTCDFLPSVDDEVYDRDGHAGEGERGDLAGHQSDGESLENGIEEYDACSDDHGGGGQEHRAERTAPASMTASSRGMPSARRSSTKSTRMIELRTTIPAPAMKPIIEVAVKNAPEQAVGGQDADQREGNRRHDDEWRHERLEPADDQAIYEDEDGGERDAEVAKDLVSDVPFAVPLQGVSLGSVGGRPCAARWHSPWGLELVHFGAELEDGVDGTLHGAGDVAGHVGHREQVLG